MIPLLFGSERKPKIHIAKFSKKLDLSDNRRIQEIILNFTDRSGECWKWTGSKMPIGYGQFSYKKRNRPAHVWSYIAFKGPVPDGLEVCHECDVRDCCNPTHLWLGTHSQNMLDAVAKNRMTPYPLDLKMRIIRARGKNGDIARRFGVKTHLVRRWRLPKVKETIRRAWRERQRLI